MLDGINHITYMTPASILNNDYAKQATLEGRLNLWCTLAKKPQNSLNFILTKSQLDQDAVQVWLARLYDNTVYRRDQRQLAQKVHSFLEGNLQGNEATFADLVGKVKHLKNNSNDPEVEEITSLFFKEDWDAILDEYFHFRNN